jgi:uncharacterized protein (DUF924 family)
MSFAVPPEVRDILEFWFGMAKGLGSPRIEWFRKDSKFDSEIRTRFGALHAKAASGGLNSWRASPEPMLALVIVLDQFSRNLYRNDPRAFAQDEMARSCAVEAILRKDDLGFIPVQRQFLYLPFEHSEALADQDRAVALMETLDAFEETQGLTAWAEKHREIIRRFGRFPHRNAILGRESTPEEVEFLKHPGSSF